MDEGELNKSEQPTPFRLKRARDKGTVARGTDLGFLTGLSVFVVFMLVMGPQFGALAMKAFRDSFVSSAALVDSPYAATATFESLLSTVARPLVFFAIAAFLTVLVFELLQTGFVFSAKPLSPDFSRLNPSKGFKRVFSVRLLIETLKNISKFVIYGAVGYFVIHGTLQSHARTVTDGGSLSVLLGHATVRLLAAFVLVAFLFAVLDQLIVRRDFLKRMRMSRRELRLEVREREGEPRQKQKRKQMHGEFVKAARSLRNLRKSDFVITNPDHIAIGLQYEPRTMAAPIIVAAGTGHLAQRLKRLAFIYAIPTIEDRPLAHDLYRKAALDRFIPEHCFKPVAEIYNAVRRRAVVPGTPEEATETTVETAPELAPEPAPSNA